MHCITTTVLTGWVFFRLHSVVEFRQFYRVHPDKFVEFKVKNELFVGIGLAPEAGVTNNKVGPGKSVVFVACVTGRLIQLVGQIDGFLCA